MAAAAGCELGEIRRKCHKAAVTSQSKQFQKTCKREVFCDREPHQCCLHVCGFELHQIVFRVAPADVAVDDIIQDAVGRRLEAVGVVRARVVVRAIIEPPHGVELIHIAHFLELRCLMLLLLLMVFSKGCLLRERSQIDSAHDCLDPGRLLKNSHPAILPGAARLWRRGVAICMDLGKPALDTGPGVCKGLPALVPNLLLTLCDGTDPVVALIPAGTRQENNEISNCPAKRNIKSKIKNRNTSRNTAKKP